MKNRNSQNLKELGRRHCYYSKDQLKRYMALPAEWKLEWLEEINQFLYEAMPPENRKIWEKFRRGEIISSK